MTNSKECFKNLLSKVGSGENTSRGMSREESALALKLMLQAQASPAQIGAFMIAHRIRRPEPQELAGMIDTYMELGPKLKSGKNQRRPICFGMPFDGRTKTQPIYPLSTLVLISEGQPVVLQGGKRMPIKYGVTTSELFSALDLNLADISKTNLQSGFEKYGFALIHQPSHFPIADKLINYRDEIGKRPPLASMELIWTAHRGEHLLASGFVHPPTEENALKVLQILGEANFVLIKGLEGGTDLPISRACITKRVEEHKIERLIMHAKEHHCSGKDIAWESLDQWKNYAIEALNGTGPLKKALLWNAGVYIWLSGMTKSITGGIEQAEECLKSGKAIKTLENLIKWSKDSKIYQNSL